MEETMSDKTPERRARRRSMEIRQSVINEAIRSEFGERETLASNSPVGRLLTRLGVTIVPDPEPEFPLPDKPLMVKFRESGTIAEIRERSGQIVAELNFVGVNVTEYQQDVVQALVYAYNAAGERKRIELVDRGESIASRRCTRMTVNGLEGSFLNKSEAVGWYVRDHASALGLEIVES